MFKEHLSSYPILEQDDIIIHDYLNNNNNKLKAKVIINMKIHQRQNNSSKLSRLM